MKIGFFTDGYFPQLNGVATSVDAWAKALEKRGHEVYIIAPKYPGTKDRVNIIRLNSFKIRQKPEIRLATYLPNQQFYKVARVDFDIIHGVSGGPIASLGLIIAKFKRVPFVFTYFTRWNLYTHYILKGRVIRPRMMEKMSQLFCDRCDLIIAPVKIIKEELVSYGIKKPIAVIPSGIDTNKYQVGDESYLRKLVETSSTSNEQILLHVGRLGKEKSIDFLIKSFRIIHQQLPKTRLVLVGDGPEKEKLKLLVKKLNLEKKVLFTGEVSHSDLPKVYAGASLFLFASRTETQGMVLLESLASGVPVVALSDAVVREMVRDKENGILVEGGVQNYAREVIKLLKNKETLEKYTKYTKKTALEFSLDKTAKELESSYLKLIKTHQEKNKPIFKKTKDMLLKYLQSPL